MDITKHCVGNFSFFGWLIVSMSCQQTSAILLDNFQANKTLVSEIEYRLDMKPDISLHQFRISPKLELENSSLSDPLCFPYDSCATRCGDTFFNFSYTCNCDSRCMFYSDCCADYNTECDANMNLSDTVIAKPSCELIFNSYMVYLTKTCSSKWNDSRLMELCSRNVPKKCYELNIVTDFNRVRSNASCETIVFDECSVQLNTKCNSVYEPMCVKLIEHACKKRASATCKLCMDALLPVKGADGVMYSNLYCAQCNFQNNYTIIQKEYFKKAVKKENHVFRYCSPINVDSCPWNERKELKELCANSSGPVSTAIGKRNKYELVYKNKYCAICNGVREEHLNCTTFETRNMLGTTKTKVWEFVTGDIQGLRLDDIPASFSMLLNFGLDGRQRVYISSEGDDEMKEHQRRCGSGKIWDPFSKICRRLHCSTEFVLVEYQCVRKANKEDVVEKDKDIVPIPDAAADFVHLSLVAEMDVLDFLQFNGQDIEDICDTIQESFSSAFNVNKNRIRNVKFNISLGKVDGLNATLSFLDEIDDFHPINFTIDFDFYEHSYNVSENEPSVDSIVSMLASALSVNGFEFGIKNVTSRIYSVQQTVEYLSNWCDPKDGGIRREYWNSDFKIIMDNNASLNISDRLKGIYVNKTGRFYSKGLFEANILYQGIQFNQNFINVSGLAVVCDWKEKKKEKEKEKEKEKLDESCLRVSLEEHEYEISDSGNLVIFNKNLSEKILNSSVYETGENRTVTVCLSKSNPDHSKSFYNRYNNPVQDMISFVFLCISISFLACVLVTYFLFSSLRNLPGCNTMNLTVSLLTMQLTFSLGQRRTVTGYNCKAVACILHYEILSCFMWMSVMAYDLYKTFGSKTMLNNKRSKSKYLLRYMAFSYGIPAFIITFTLLMDIFLEDSLFAPHYGINNVCWINTQLSAILYFAVPLAAVMVTNFVLFILTILSIKNVKHVLYLSDQKKNKKGKSDVFLYARMAVIVGLTWTLAFVAALVDEQTTLGQVLRYFYIFFNTLQGLFIFGVFVCNRRVLSLYRDRYRKVIQKISDLVGKEESSNPIARFPNVMKRTVSTDTVVSTVSNSSTGSKKLETVQEIDENK